MPAVALLTWKSRAISKEFISELYVSFMTKQLFRPSFTSRRIATGSNFAIFSVISFGPFPRYNITAKQCIAFSTAASPTKGITNSPSYCK